MNQIEIIKPDFEELPSKYADRLGIQYKKFAKRELKKAIGQFFSPLEISSFMGKLSEINFTKLKILDPGCGTAILSCSLIEHLVKNDKLKEIELIVYETDEDIYKFLESSLNYLTSWLSLKGISLNYNIFLRDFVLENALVLEEYTSLFNDDKDLFDIIISNPPYFKLAINDKRSIATKSIVNGHPNIYAMFMAIASRLLKNDGELIFITPRSFASGSYFKLFREKFFRIIEINKVHIFVTRTGTFKRDNVLQETIIIKGIRKKEINPKSKVLISSSNNLNDIGENNYKIFRHEEILDLKTSEKILHLPSSDYEKNILNVFKGWNGNLKKYDISISTGPVVSFRNKKWIVQESIKENIIIVPLYWLHNVRPMNLIWPFEKKDKDQYIIQNDESLSVLIPNKNYIFLRRFSTKDDKHRLIAAPYFSNGSNYDYIGVENKVNYIYRKNGHLDRSEIVGICALLNCTLFDTYFRIINGNVNVSATELRAMPLPEYKLIKAIGENIILSNDFSIEKVNFFINDLLKIKNINYE
jgi:adenine-specific DNA-methyltransferase